MDKGRTCSRKKEQQDYTHLQELTDNIPYILMVLLGSLILLVGLDLKLVGIVLSVSYVIYGTLGAFWIIWFVCPYCNFYGTRSCPCGYGQFAVSFRSKQREEDFKGKFRKHIPVIVPLWIVPVIGGIVSLLFDLSVIVLVLMVLFILDSYIILPLVSKKYGCAHCPQKDTCPWMKVR
ncbi:MAG: hypothetical protein MUC62_09665 [Candidatus Thermoplasmatota archaeon]|nr:hypothetical protein [Candidatus Thermoplasmatota archaeon]